MRRGCAWIYVPWRPGRQEAEGLMRERRVRSKLGSQRIPRVRQSWKAKNEEGYVKKSPRGALSRRKSTTCFSRGVRHGGPEWRISINQTPRKRKDVRASPARLLGPIKGSLEWYPEQGSAWMHGQTDSSLDSDKGRAVKPWDQCISAARSALCALTSSLGAR